MKTKIDHLNLVVADLERSARFYERVFGFRRGFSAILEGEWFETVTQIPGARAECLFLELPGGLEVSGARLELIRYDFPTQDPDFKAPLSAAVLGVRHFAIEVEDLDATLAKALLAGFDLLSLPVEVPFPVGDLGRKWLCYGRDPDGVLLEIAAYRK